MTNANNILSWDETYRAVFGPLSDSQAEAWAKYIAKKCNGVTSLEMDEVMEAMANSWGDAKSRPTVITFSGEIWRARMARKNGRTESVAFSEFEESEKHRVWCLTQEIYEWAMLVTSKGQEAWEQVWLRIVDEKNTKIQKSKLLTSAMAVGFDWKLLPARCRTMDTSADGLN